MEPGYADTQSVHSRVIAMSTAHKQLAMLLLVGCGMSSAIADTQYAAYDAPPSKEENAGFLSGAVLGGLAGGPPGLIVGGALGALIGDGWHAKGRVRDLQIDLYSAQLEVTMIRERNAILQQEYQLVRQQLDGVKSNPAQMHHASLVQPQRSACCDNTVLSLHFRSGSAAIEAHYEEQLSSLVRLAAQMSAASVEITGYADRNGDAEKNLLLSRQRSESVRRFLHTNGIAASAITTIAYGEARPLQSIQQMETDFFDRRVIVRLRDSTRHLLSSTPDND